MDVRRDGDLFVKCVSVVEQMFNCKKILILTDQLVKCLASCVARKKNEKHTSCTWDTAIAKAGRSSLEK